jgi:SAM-dependent methyltransferase
MTLKDRLSYYVSASYRRRLLDRLQQQHRGLYRGIVLDIGGRDRGAFKKPKDAVEKWIYADIEPRNHPDLVLDVANMEPLADCSIDVVNAIELFEHVDRIDAGIKECFRVLRPNGIMILAAPFLYPIHADPFDFQRWTDTRWQSALKAAGFEVEKSVIMGRFFLVWAGMARALIREMPGLIRKFLYVTYPLLDLVARLDETRLTRNNRTLSSYHGGYFMICRKRETSQG